MKRRLLKEILDEAASELEYGDSRGLELAEEIRNYLTALPPLFRIDVAMPAAHIRSELVMVTRFVWAFSGRMNRWYYGWFSIDRATGLVAFRTEHGLRFSMHADILLWMESIPHPTRFSQPIINNFYEKEPAPPPQKKAPRKKPKEQEEEVVLRESEGAVA
jgi:hypothetical protein